MYVKTEVAPDLPRQLKLSGVTLHRAPRMKRAIDQTVTDGTCRADAIATGRSSAAFDLFAQDLEFEPALFGCLQFALRLDERRRDVVEALAVADI